MIISQMLSACDDHCQQILEELLGWYVITYLTNSYSKIAPIHVCFWHLRINSNKLTATKCQPLVRETLVYLEQPVRTTFVQYQIETFH